MSFVCVLFLQKKVLMSTALQAAAHEYTRQTSVQMQHGLHITEKYRIYTAICWRSASEGNLAAFPSLAVGITGTLQKKYSYKINVTHYDSTLNSEHFNSDVVNKQNKTKHCLAQICACGFLSQIYIYGWGRTSWQRQPHFRMKYISARIYPLKHA